MFTFQEEYLASTRRVLSIYDASNEEVMITGKKLAALATTDDFITRIGSKNESDGSYTIYQLISIRPKDENLISAKTENSATMAGALGRIFGRN